MVVVVVVCFLPCPPARVQVCPLMMSPLTSPVSLMDQYLYSLSGPSLLSPLSPGRTPKALSPGPFERDSLCRPSLLPMIVPSRSGLFLRALCSRRVVIVIVKNECAMGCQAITELTRPSRSDHGFCCHSHITGIPTPDKDRQDVTVGNSCPSDTWSLDSEFELTQAESRAPSHTNECEL